MRTLPIAFTGAMVRAERAGRKGQTRRVIKPQPVSNGICYDAELGDILCHDDFLPPDALIWPDTFDLVHMTIDRCPYGGPGDLLWVRERQRVIEVDDFAPPEAESGRRIRVRYEADGAESDWLPYPPRLKGTPVVGRCLAYGGYRESSRTTLRVTDVRVERVQDISEDDATWEGCDPFIDPQTLHVVTAKTTFADLWDSINAKRGYGWEANPWVWVVGFERAEG